MTLSLLKSLPLAILMFSGIGEKTFNIDPFISLDGSYLYKQSSSTFINTASASAQLYDSLNLDELGLSTKAFTYAMEGYQKLKEDGVIHNTSVITIVDFDQPSSQKRMYVIDLEHHKLLFNTWSAHGKNTGVEKAEYFSNQPSSNKSSLGFFVTNNTYYGSKGYSLKLTGLEPRVNDNAFKRAIVLHGAWYVSQALINTQGYIGRSLGCPAVSTEMNRPIIDAIKDGSLFFIYNSTYESSLQLPESF
ncbi:MAG: murein L,D-transpeptidase catalytic domain family protein [Niabella sp.]